MNSVGRGVFWGIGGGTAVLCGAVFAAVFLSARSLLMRVWSICY